MNDLKEKFQQHHPGVLYLALDNFGELQSYLQQKGWVELNEEVISLEKPGEGNMNMVVRIVTNRRRLILKQSRPWVQKYPQVAAPMNRSEVEAKFYQLISQKDTLKGNTPDLLGYDESQFLLALEDIGEGSDYTYLYQDSKSIAEEEIRVLTSFISELHRIQADQASIDFPTNTAMKELNHEHIFRFPFQEDNGFNLDDVQDGLQELSLTYKRHDELKNQVSKLGERYLAIGNTLLHGDYYPGSWLKTTSGVCIIDPEFAFMGDAEFDIGVMVAHLMMAQASTETMQQVKAKYQRPDGYNEDLQQAFTGVEILRRLIGLAQLPLTLTLAEKENLLTRAADLVLQYQKA